MPFILRRTDQGGGWVAPPGSPKAYTHRRDKAQRYATRETADADRCVGNEVIEEIDR